MRSVTIAANYARAGDRAAAFEWLQKAIDEPDSYVLWLSIDPSFEKLHSDPRYQQFLRRLKLDRQLEMVSHLPHWLPAIFLRNLHVGNAVVSIHFYRKGKSTHFDVLEKRGRLHVLRQPSPWSLTAGAAERIQDVMESLIP